MQTNPSKVIRITPANKITSFLASDQWDKGTQSYKWFSWLQSQWHLVVSSGRNTLPLGTKSPSVQSSKIHKEKSTLSEKQSQSYIHFLVPILVQ